MRVCFLSRLNQHSRSPLHHLPFILLLLLLVRWPLNHCNAQCLVLELIVVVPRLAPLLLTPTAVARLPTSLRSNDPNSLAEDD